MSTINIHHQGITLEWVIKDPIVADKVMSSLWALIGQSGAVPVEAKTKRPLSTRRRTITVDFLREVAQVYVEAPEGGRSRAVREAFEVSNPTANNYIQRARQEHLLGPSTTHSRAGRLPRTIEATLTDGVETVSR